MPKAPKSYLNRRRPPLQEALLAEQQAILARKGRTDSGVAALNEEIRASLERKGYYTPRPRPWQLGFRHRGLGHGDWAVLDRFGDLVAETPNREDAELIVAAVNAYKPPPRKARRSR
jgi:hypothetical protein